MNTKDKFLDLSNGIVLTDEEKSDNRKALEQLRALADDCDAQLAAYRGGNPKEAIKLLLPLLSAIPGIPDLARPLVEGAIKTLGAVIDKL